MNLQEFTDTHPHPPSPSGSTLSRLVLIILKCHIWGINFFMGPHIWPLRGTFNADSWAVSCLSWGSGSVRSQWLSLPPPLSFSLPLPRLFIITFTIGTWSELSPVPQLGRKFSLITYCAAHLLHWVIQEHWFHQLRSNFSGVVRPSSCKQPTNTLSLKGQPPPKYPYSASPSQVRLRNVKVGSNGLLVMTMRTLSPLWSRLTFLRAYSVSGTNLFLFLYHLIQS